MKKIYSLQSVRFYLALSIFLCHLDTILVSTKGKNIFGDFCHNGNFAVTFFFVLSGFCIALGYSGKFCDFSRKEYFDFIKRRISKIYPLYIISMLLALLCNLAMKFSKAELLRNVAYLFLSATMLQTVSVKYWNILNSACWYISSIFVIYMVTPFIIQKLHAVKNDRKKLIRINIIAFVLLFLVTFVFKVAIPKNTSELILYVSPFVRIFYFFFGLIMGYLRKLKTDSKGMGRFEIPLMIAMIIAYYIGCCCELLNPYVGLLYLVIFGGFILVLSYEDGAISKFLSRKINVQLGALSMEFYMLHYVIVHYGGLFLHNTFDLTFELELLVSAFLLVLTYVFALMYKCRVFKR